MRSLLTLTCPLLAVLVLVGCGDDDTDATERQPDPSTERPDPPAKPPRGWRTVSNGQAGFTISVPDDWAVGMRQTATQVRSPDKQIALTIAADRSQGGRTLPAPEYARSVFGALPGFRKLHAVRGSAVRASPYENRRIDGTGRRRGRRQQITVAAYHRPRRVTYSAIVFSADIGGRATHQKELARLLSSFRARPPER